MPARNRLGNRTPKAFTTNPTITIASDFDGANASGEAYRNKFSGKYSHRIFNGIGHNVPQEAPQAFAQAIMDVDAMRRSS